MISTAERTISATIEADDRASDVTTIPDESAAPYSSPQTPHTAGEKAHVVANAVAVIATPLIIPVYLYSGVMLNLSGIASCSLYHIKQINSLKAEISGNIAYPDTPLRYASIASVICGLLSGSPNAFVLPNAIV